MMIPGVKKKKLKNAWKFVEAASPGMTVGNTDGLGYAAITKEGKVFGERWLKNNLAWTLNPDNEQDTKIQSHYGKAVKTINEYSNFGDIKKDEAVSIMLHTRYATSAKGLMNTHPFEHEGTALIHNGVIRNDTQLLSEYDPDKKRKSTCDSESILFGYLGEKINHNPKLINELTSELSGYYAVGVLTNNSADLPVMDIFKSDQASLFMCHVDELDASVYCTSSSVIDDTLEKLGWSRRTMYEINAGYMFRHNAITGELLGTFEFEEKKYEYYSSGGYGGYKSTHPWGSDYETSSYGERYRGRASSKQTSNKPVTTTIYPPAALPSTSSVGHYNDEDESDFDEIERRFRAMQEESTEDRPSSYEESNIIDMTTYKGSITDLLKEDKEKSKA